MAHLFPPCNDCKENRSLVGCCTERFSPAHVRSTNRRYELINCNVAFRSCFAQTRSGVEEQCPCIDMNTFPNRRASLEYAFPGGQMQRRGSSSPKENGTLHSDANSPQVGCMSPLWYYCSRDRVTRSKVRGFNTNVTTQCSTIEVEQMLRIFVYVTISSACCHWKLTCDQVLLFLPIPERLQRSLLTNSSPVSRGHGGMDLPKAARLRWAVRRSSLCSTYFSERLQDCTGNNYRLKTQAKPMKTNQWRVCKQLLTLLLPRVINVKFPLPPDQNIT